MVARPSGVLNRHRGFQNICPTSPVFTVENSADNNPVHTAHSKSVHNMHGVRPMTAEHSPTARPAELHNVKPAQFLRTSESVLKVDWLRTSSGTEKSSN